MKPPAAEMEKGYTLGVRQWTAFCQSADGEATYGDVKSDGIIPAGFRRRMGRLERLAVRCILSILQSGTTAEIIFCSRYGNLETLDSLLRSIGAGEPVSPMAFSGSVHNAAPGIVGQIRKERISHTALAAGEDTLPAGLMEAYARLAADGCADVIVAYADLPLAGAYGDLDREAGPEVGLAMRLVLEEADSEAGAKVLRGRAGALALIEQLGLGTSKLAVGGGS